MILCTSHGGVSGFRAPNHGLEKPALEAGKLDFTAEIWVRGRDREPCVYVN